MKTIKDKQLLMAADFAGYPLKEEIKAYLEKKGWTITDIGVGGGVILPEEIKDLMDYGITRLYSPDDGRAMGLQGMINDKVMKSDYPTPDLQLPEGKDLYQSLLDKDVTTVSRLISLAEA